MRLPHLLCFALIAASACKKDDFDIQNLNGGKIIAQGTPEEIRANPNPTVQQFINGEAEGDAADDSGELLYRETLLGSMDSGRYSQNRS